MTAEKLQYLSVNWKYLQYNSFLSNNYNTHHFENLIDIRLIMPRFSSAWDQKFYFNFFQQNNFPQLKHCYIILNSINDDEEKNYLRQFIKSLLTHVQDVVYFKIKRHKGINELLLTISELDLKQYNKCKIIFDFTLLDAEEINSLLFYITLCLRASIKKNIIFFKFQGSKQILKYIKRIKYIIKYKFKIKYINSNNDIVQSLIIIKNTKEDNYINEFDKLETILFNKFLITHQAKFKF